MHATRRAAPSAISNVTGLPATMLRAIACGANAQARRKPKNAVIKIDVYFARLRPELNAIDAP